LQQVFSIFIQLMKTWCQFVFTYKPLLKQYPINPSYKILNIMYTRIFIFSAILSVFSINCVCWGFNELKPDSTPVVKKEVFQLAPDDPIVAMLDSLALLTVFQ
jgi:hypothetical protein